MRAGRSIDFIDRSDSDNPFQLPASPAYCGVIATQEKPMSKSKPSKSKPGKSKASPKVAKAEPAASPGSGDRGPAIDIGIGDGDRRRIAQGLSAFLADSFTLYLKTHNFHWNVTGAMFNSLHTMFEGQYTEQWGALDEIAERIRALGFNAPGSYAEFISLSSIKEEPGLRDAADWREMVRQLTVGNEAVCRTARKVLKTADEAGDDPSVDLLTQRLQTHEKYAWMLRSLLQ
jgi:starvation-inducible DNA-binding protein